MSDKLKEVNKRPDDLLNNIISPSLAGSTIPDRLVKLPVDRLVNLPIADVPEEPIAPRFPVGEKKSSAAQLEAPRKR